MLKHVIVDGSNIATEGRSKPSLKQLHEAVLAFLEEHPKTAVTVIVDATFGHRIDPKEVTAFNKAVEHNELVTPPAGTVGRGDAFVLSIAEKAGASILSNDSYQEFHGRYKWLFDEGRLIGGKPVPHIGWVFVERLPVRGEKSRMSERSLKTGGSGARADRKVSSAAMKPMPVPKSPPPGASLPSKKSESSTQPSKKVETSKGVNEILPFLHFVENHTVGSIVDGVVESYSSHGAYVQIGEVRGYVPLRLLGDPPPRSAREAMKLGETVPLEVVEIIGGRRSVNLKPVMTSGSRKKPATTTKKSPTKKSPTKKAADKTTPVRKTPVKKTPAKTASGTPRASGKVDVKDVIARTSKTKQLPAKKPVAKKPAAKKTAVKKPVAPKSLTTKSAASKAPVKKSPVKKAPAKKTRAVKTQAKK